MTSSIALYHCLETVSGGHGLVVHPLVDIMGTVPGPVNSKLASLKGKLNDPTPQPGLLLCLG